MNRESDTPSFDLPSQEGLAELETHLQCQLNGRVRHLRLSVRDNGLVLHGQTQTYYSKQLAQHALMEAFDMPIRANEIEVI